MRQNLYQKTFGFNVVTVHVFWTLILFNPQPSDGIPNGTWGTLFDHYGRDLEGLKASIGDVLKTMNNDFILIFDDEKYFKMQSVEPAPSQTEVQCHLYPYPHNNDNWHGLLKKVRPPNNPGVTLALAAKFANKYLPFHPVHCNRRDYMKYILYGVITRSKQFKECPLAARLASVTVEMIKYKDFKLMDSDGKAHDFAEYAKSKEQRLLDKIESEELTAKLNAWYQHGSSHKSMLRGLFTCWGSAIRKSSRGAILKRVKLKASNGRPPLRYRIELVDKSTVNEAASFMHKNYACRDTLASSLVLQTDEETELSIWVESLEEGLSLAAFLEDEQENRGPIIGCNVLELVKRDSAITTDIYSEVEIYQLGMGKIVKTIQDLKSKVDVFSLYKCSSYVEGAGMAVGKDYEGRGIATELLRARGKVCRMAGTPVSVTVFDGVASQRVAQKCGYRTLSELDLRTYRINGRIVYTNPQTPVIKYMGKRYY